jgi:hypothetical protein
LGTYLFVPFSLYLSLSRLDILNIIHSWAPTYQGAASHALKALLSAEHLDENTSDKQFSSK